MEENTQERIEMPIFDDNDTDKLNNDNEKNLDKQLDINKFEEIKIKKKGIFKDFKDYHPYIRALLFLIIFYFITCDTPWQGHDYYKNRKDIHNSLLKGKKYFDACMNGILLNNITFSKPENPDISVVIPVYNSEKYIKGVLRSIQNQNVSNFEIILVNDFSPDNVSNIIMEMQKEDPRIILINNTENRGTLYSRCIGVLSTKGKYIFTLDNDDLFYDETVFDEVYREAIKGDFDIIEFKGVLHYNYHINLHHIEYTRYSYNNHNGVIRQPELSIYPRKRKNEFGVFDCYLWGKIIKAEKYKKAINLMGKNIYSLKIIWGEDLITSFVLFRTIDSFKFIGKNGLFRFYSLKTATYTTSLNLLSFSLIVYLDKVYNMTSNTIEEKKYVTYLALDSFEDKRRITDLSDENKKYLVRVLNKILKSEYIPDLDKKKIRDYYKKYSKYGIILD